MSKGHGVVQRELLERLSLLRQPSLPALWHPLVFQPVFNELVRGPDGAIWLQGSLSDARRRALRDIDPETLMLLFDEVAGNSRLPDAHARNKLWWQFDVGREQPGRGLGYTLGMVFENDTASRRSSVYRAVRKLENAGLIEVARRRRTRLVRLPSTAAERELTDRRVSAAGDINLRRRLALLNDHLDRFFSFGYDRTQQCLDGALCSRKKHATLYQEQVRARRIVDLGEARYPRVWPRERPWELEGFPEGHLGQYT